MPKYVESKIYSNLPLEEGQEVFENWKNPPVTPESRVYVFNLTNEEAFLRGKKILPHICFFKMQRQIEINYYFLNR